MTIIQVQDVTGYEGGLTLNPRQTAILGNAIIPGIQNDLEKYLNRKVEPTIVRETLVPDDRMMLVLTEAPVWEILSVKRAHDGSDVPFVQPQVVTPVPLEIPDKYKGVIDRVYDPAALGIGAEPYMIPVDQTFGFLGLQGVDYVTVMNDGLLGPFFPLLQFIVTYVAGYYGTYDEALKLDLARVCARECEQMFDDAMTLKDSFAEQAESSDTAWRAASKGWRDDELKKWDRLKRRVIV